MRRLLAAFAGATLTLALPTTAEAATYAATGERCTIAGSSGADTLRGTSRADVICGRGGNDVLIGNGGNDLLDGGTGADTLRGGGGNDLLIGGTRGDTMSGGSSFDTVSYAERSAAVTADLDGKRDDGASGEGDLIGTDVENLIGGAGGDRLSGSSTANKLYGNGGNDALLGMSGNDRLSGGSGNDRIGGGPGGDTLSGGPGNDDIDGAGGFDTIDGGTGTNACGTDGGDQLSNCAPDTAPPVIVSGSITPSPIDVTSADRSVRARMHLRDDTGVVDVQVGSWGDTGTGPRFPGRADLVSGTNRDGIWELRGTAVRYGPPGDFSMSITIADAIDRSTSTTYRPAITVTDANPDNREPVVQSVSLARTSVDVRQAAATMNVSARITDDLSGAEQVELCAWRPDETGTYVFALGWCRVMDLSSGTTRDGTWKGSFPIPKGAPSGLWNISIQVFDRANYVDGTVVYYGEDVLADGYTGWNEDTARTLTKARFTVIGSNDTTAATAATLTTDAISVDTYPGSASVNLRVRAKDAPGEGVTGVSAWVYNDQLSSVIGGPEVTFGVRTSGTPTDGWWTLKVTFPQGSAAGRYPVHDLWVTDIAHNTDYTVPGSTQAGWPGRTLFPASALQTASGAPWDGVITVVNSQPAG